MTTWYVTATDNYGTHISVYEENGTYYFTAINNKNHDADFDLDYDNLTDCLTDFDNYAKYTTFRTIYRTLNYIFA